MSIMCIDRSNHIVLSCDSSKESAASIQARWFAKGTISKLEVFINLINLELVVLVCAGLCLSLDHFQAKIFDD